MNNMLEVTQARESKENIFSSFFKHGE